MAAVEVPQEFVRSGVLHELVEKADVVLAEARVLLEEDRDRLQVRNVREHVAGLARLGEMLGALDWPE